jgi:hypothetical protein
MIIPPAVDTALVLILAAVTTLGTIATVGLGFLSRPGRPTLLWSIGFAVAMTGTFAVAAGHLNDDETLRRAGLGILMGAPALLWSGFRAHWGLRPRAWVGPAVTAASVILLTLPALQPYFPELYRCVFFLAALFAGLFVVDWARVGSRTRDPLTAPLAAASIAFVAVGLGVAASWISDAPGMRDLELARLTSSVGMLFYVSCASAAVVAISTRHARAARRDAAVGDWDAFRELAGVHSREAVRRGDPLSAIYLQLDDLEDIRRAEGPGIVLRLTRLFVDEVREVFPTSALIDSPSPGSAVALVTLGDSAVRSRLRTLLERISTLDTGGRLPIHPSASAGWAPSSIVGYEVDALLYMAREAAVVASQDGGDRWERVGVTVTDRILSRSAQP